MYRIFIVEDDAAIAGVIRRHLEGWGYTVRCAERFDDVLSEFAAFDPHLVLLDISLPFFNGYHWCQEIRRVSQVPILFLSSASENMEHRHGHPTWGRTTSSPSPFDLSGAAGPRSRPPSAGPMTTRGRATWWSTTAPCSTARASTVTYQGQTAELTEKRDPPAPGPLGAQAQRGLPGGSHGRPVGLRRLCG